MFIPLGTDRALARPTLVNYGLVIACALAFLGQVIAARTPGGELWIQQHLALTRSGPIWQYITYAFLHGDLAHIFFNMLFLWVFGPSVEDRLGRWWYLAFFLTGSAAAGLAHVLASPAPVVGASGGVAAVTGAFLVLFPRTHIRTLVFFFLIGVFAIPSVWFIAFAIARDFLPFALGFRDNVAREAHLGGYLFGAVVSLLLLWFRVLPREPYDLLSIFKQRQRRAAIKEAVRGVEKRGKLRPDEGGTITDDPAAPLRAKVTARLAASDATGAATAYRELIEAFNGDAKRTTLSPRSQLDVANALFANQDHEAAAWAYERYIGAYPKDADSGTVRLMLAITWGRYLGRRDEAKQMAIAALEHVRDDDQRALAESLTTEFAGPN